MTYPPVPADVYIAARRVYIGTSTDEQADDPTVRAWGLNRWPKGIPSAARDLTFWVMSQAVQDGHE